MKILLKNFIVIHVYFFTSLYAQTFEVTSLSKILNETSGLESIEEYYLTHNDSGNSSSLFGIDSHGRILFEREYSELQNIDWEDLAKDSQFLYVADTGNNYDSRQNLRILKFDLPTLEYLGAINFSYTEQENFDINPITEYDAEAIVSLHDRLVLFSKNRKDANTQLYFIPKELGNYNLETYSSLATDLIITGADYSEEWDLLVLTGTKDFKNYYLQLYEGFCFIPLGYIMKKEFLIPINSVQVEAVKIIDRTTLLLTSESEDDSRLPKMIWVSF